MFLPKDLLFSEVRQKIKLFLTKYADVESGIYQTEYQEAYDRYTELVSDQDFQDKLFELSHLEMIIAQVHCIQNIEPRYATAKTNRKNTFVYARMSYPRLRTNVQIMNSCIGTLEDFGGNPKRIAQHPLAIAESYNRLLSRMRSEFIYPIYEATFKRKK